MPRPKAEARAAAHAPRFYAAPYNAEVTRKVFERRKMLESRWFVRVDASFKDDWKAFDQWFEDNAADHRHDEASSLLRKIIDPLRNAKDGAVKPPTRLKFASAKDNAGAQSHGWAVWVLPSAKVTLYIESKAQGAWIETKLNGSRRGDVRFFIALDWEKAGVELQQRLISASC